MTIKRLDRNFYTREDVLNLSRELLGKVLVTNFDGILTSGKIVETEAYRAPDDQACHAYLNRNTNRTKVMFQQGGAAYIYLCYGIHHLFNIVTAKAGMAHAILVRGIEPIDNVDNMLERRGLTAIEPRLTAGPGSLSKALGLHKNYSGVDMIADDSPIWIEDRGYQVEEESILTGPRVGVAYAGESANWPWRFQLKNSKWVSKPRVVKY